jgi:hypothetical protein
MNSKDWWSNIMTNDNALRRDFAAFRTRLRQLLLEHGVPSTPDWTEDDIVRAFRDRFFEMEFALAVLVTEPHTRHYLEQHDPKALAQAERARGGREL